MDTPLRQVSALAPVSMSLAIVLAHAARVGIVHEPDEGAAAHIFQLLMAAQVPVVIFFALKWVPRAPRRAAQVLAAQAGAAIIAFASVFFLT